MARDIDSVLRPLLRERLGPVGSGVSPVLRQALLQQLDRCDDLLEAGRRVVNALDKQCSDGDAGWQYLQEAIGHLAHVLDGKVTAR